jgi:hypothetical protein
MLVDPTPQVYEDEQRAFLQSLLEEDPSKLRDGMVLLNHWNPELVFSNISDRYWPDLYLSDGGFHESLQRRADELKKVGLPPDFCSYGVCDTPDQVLEKYPALATCEMKFCICFVCIRKADQPRHDGWRWEKWGPYIGSQNPQRDYLADEPHIDKIYTFHICPII